MNDYQARVLDGTRRQFLQRCGVGLGSMFLAGASQGGVQAPSRAAKARSVIYLHMSGSPPQQELFDDKPKLREFHLKPCPDSLLQGERFAFIKGHPTLLGSPFAFSSCGQSGQRISELFPNLQTVADELTVIRSMRTKEFNHAPAELYVHTGENRPGYPAIGAWASYGLGSLNSNLPGFMVLVSGGTDPTAGKSVWGSGFLPSIHQGVQCRSGSEPIFYVSDPDGLDRAGRRRSLDALKSLNEIELLRSRDPETRTRAGKADGGAGRALCATVRLGLGLPRYRPGR